MGKYSLAKEIVEVGCNVLDTEVFAQCRQQKLHRTSNVSQHSQAVTLLALKLSENLENKGIYVDRERVILTGLCHDLGLLGFRQKYGFKTHFIKAFIHPVESVEVTKDLIYIDEYIEADIKRHMWPLCIIPPTNREGWIITLADKICALFEFFGSTMSQRYSDIVDVTFGLKTNLDKLEREKTNV